MTDQPEIFITEAVQPSIEINAGANIELQVLEPLPVTTVEVSVIGPQGPPGSAFSGYVHQQLTASSVWTINHNLNYRPSVELLNSGSQEIEGDVVHTSQNQVVISFSTPIAGFARLV